MAGDLQSYAILFSIFLISVLFLHKIFFQTKHAKRLPPGPTAIPIIGHLHLLAPLPHQAFHNLSTRYGPLIHLRLGSVPAVVASDSATAKEILKTQETNFASRPISSAVRLLTYGAADFSFAPYGPYWRFMKKLCMSELLGGRTLEQMQTVRREEVWRVLRLLLSKKSEKAEAVDVGKELSTMANNMISRMATSRICSDGERDAEEVQKLVREAMLLAGSFNLSDYIGFCRNLDLQGLKKRFVEARRRSGEKMERILKEHEEKKKKKRSKGDDRVKDILDILVGISEDENAETQLTRENIKAFVMIQQINVFIGSHLAY